MPGRLITALIAATALTAALPAGAEPSQVQVFPFPQPIRYNHHNDDYTVKVREPGGVWQDLYEYNVKVDWDKPQKDASMVFFNFNGPVELSVQKNNGTFSKVAIRPTSKGIKSVVRDGIVYFTLTKPENLSVEFDDDHLHNLHVFTRGIRSDMPAIPANLSSYDIGVAQTPDLTQPVVYFGPGVYDGDFRVRSNTTLYISGSAILKKPLIIDNVENVKVISDGLFDGAGGLKIFNSKNIVLDGLIFINQEHGTMVCVTSQDVQELNIRTIGGGEWSDGLGHYGCERVTVAGAFIRTSDDSLTLYNHRGDVWGNTRDILVKDSTLWADVAHNVMIGIHGNTPSPAHPDPEVIERATFSNIDVLEHDEDEPDYQGAIGLMVGDDNLVKDITFENWRVERIEEGKLFSMQVLFNAKYNTSPGRGIENVTLRNISFTGKGSPTASLIKGYSAERGVKNVIIENVTVAGKKIAGPAPSLLDIGPFVENVTYK